MTRMIAKKKKQNQFNDRTKKNNIMIQSSQEKCLCFIFETILTFPGFMLLWNGYILMNMMMM